MTPCFGMKNNVYWAHCLSLVVGLAVELLGMWWYMCTCVHVYIYVCT